MVLHLAAATEADLPEIRDIQIESWRGAYRGMLSEDFLGREVEDVLGKRWASHPGPRWIVDTVREGDRIAGFIAVNRDKGPGAYVDNLHVAKWAQGRGAGRILMAGAARKLAEEDVERMWLTVIRENDQARRFYRGIGGDEVAQQEELLYGQPVVSLKVEWLNLPELGATLG